MPQPDLKLPEATRSGLAGDLSRLGLERGDTVLVHSAMSRIGWVPGGAAGLLEVFGDVLGREGTLAAPTFPFTGSLLEHLRSEPVFDVERTPSRMGALSEVVRTHPEAVRSLGPTHPVAAIGPMARFLTEAHRHSSGPCDEHSPFVRLTSVRGKVLLLGVDFRSCTLLHAAEELARVPFIDFDTRYPVQVRTPEGEWKALIYCHSARLSANFSAIEPFLIAENLLSAGAVAHAEARLFVAADLLRVAGERLREDPYLLRRRP